jgi:glycosyltransferase involved in cell wall biosynthesis
LLDIEVIIIDDGSTDNSSQIVHSYATNDSRISFYQLMHCGVSSVRNFGIKHANGEYIGFVDGDDYLENTFAEKMYVTAKMNNSILCCCGVNKIHSKKFKHEKFIPKTPIKVEDFFKQNPNIRNPVWNKIYKTELIKKNGNTFPPSVKFAEDYAFTVLYYFSNKEKMSISYVREPLYNYWRHDTSVMSNLHLDLSEKINDIMANIEHINSYLKRSGQINLQQTHSYRTILIDYFLITLPLLLIHNTLIHYKIEYNSVNKAMHIYNDYQKKYVHLTPLTSKLRRLKFRLIVFLTRIYAPLLPKQKYS